MLLFENTIIELLDSELKPESLLRVLWISPDEMDIIVVEINDNKKMKFPFSQNYNEIVNEIKGGKARILEIDPDLRLISPDESYLSKYKSQRDANWDVIKEIVIKEPDIYISKLRGTLVNEVVEKTGKSKKEIYRLLKRYWFYGKIRNSLLRNYFDCGAPGKPRVYSKKPGPRSNDGNEYIVTDNDKKIFEASVNKFHVKQKMNLTATHQHMCEENYNSGYYRKNGVLVPMIEPKEAPTLRQFLYWYNNEYPFANKYSNRHGKRKAEMDIRPLLGDATERALAVGYLYEIDSTPADIILVAEDRKTIIGTPTLYIVKDVFSRMIVGFHASLSSASTIELMVALENAATSKVEFCRQYEIDIEESEWPSKNLPQFLNGDRGDLKAKWSEKLVSLKVDVDNAPSYRGDLKPFVEQHFRLTNDKIRELFSKVGAKPGKARERGDFDPARNAALTIYEFTQFMIHQIKTFNKSALNKEYFVTREMFEDKVELTPLGVWNWGTRKNVLHQVPRELLRYTLLPKETATVTRWGIEFSKMCYTNEYGLKAGWFEEGHIDGQKHINISYDPRNVSSIFICLRDGKIKQCNLTEKYKEYDGLHIEEVKTIMKYKKETINKKEREEKQHQAELHAFSKKLAKDATKKTKDATADMSFNARQKNKRETRKTEARSIGSQNAWTATDTNNTSEEIKLSTEIISFPIETHIPSTNGEQNKIHHLYKSKNKERRRNHESLE
ncbi:Mu transposase C-terminal domain-containing protein [Bacillus sp. JJ1773]|uniref:Mu transposase C-terminal domain-containing protein n=1 Tax=Bacillus sp. JJ1773 TaxID=3122965 RepID=UPI002FFE6209